MNSIQQWYTSHHKTRWALILVPLWLQPIHMFGMAEIVAHQHGIVDLNNLQFHIMHWSFWTDIFWLSIDYLEWVAIIAATLEFVRWMRK